MKYFKAQVIKLLVVFFENDFKRIEHALDVLKYAEELTNCKDTYDVDIIIASTLLHDVGIKQSEKELGYNDGKSQEQYGPLVAGELLKSIDFPEEKIKKVKEIIGNHHSPSRYEYVELAILKEADRIVNEKEEI